MLFIADPHFGKAATFRLSGIPVPETAHEADLLRLSRMLTETGAGSLVILGDFFHSRLGITESTRSALSQWREKWRQLAITLVIGNHDRHAGLPEDRLAIRCLEEPLLLAPFAGCHHPQPVEGHYVLAGHLHPAHRVAASVVPCFQVSARQTILPAFGSFTGTSRIQPLADDEIYLAGSQEIVHFPKRRK